MTLYVCTHPARVGVDGGTKKNPKKLELWYHVVYKRKAIASGYLNATSYILQIESAVTYLSMDIRKYL